MTYNSDKFPELPLSLCIFIHIVAFIGISWVAKAAIPELETPQFELFRDKRPGARLPIFFTPSAP